MRYDVPVFDPFKLQGEDFYRPGNEPAACLMQIQYIYEDIAKLFEILARLQEEYERKLLSKYIIMELISMDRFIQRLADLIISGHLDFPAEPEEVERVKQLYKAYKRARKQHWKGFGKVRDKIAAHRDPLDLITIAKIWDSIDLRDILSILKSVPPFFNYVKGLNVFTWVKSEKTGHGKLSAYVSPFDLGGIQVVEEEDGYGG